MDPNRFDTITRYLGTVRSRRGMLKTLGVAALSAAGLASGGRGAGAAPSGKVTICHWDEDLGAYKQLSVSQNAVRAHEAHGDTSDPDFNNDPKHCGRCGNVCRTEAAGAAATCSGGECGFTCLEGFVDCNGACVDYSSDPHNCGECGNACSTGYCTSGQCVTCPSASSTSTYHETCWAISQTCTQDGMRLSAACEASSAPWTRSTSIVVNTCAGAGYIISNCGGTLQCGNC